jgi:hypothetical protein
MKKYIIKNKLGEVIQVIKTNDRLTVHPAWGKPERVIPAEMDHDPKDVVDNILIDGAPYVSLKAEYTIVEKESKFEDLFEEYNRIRKEILSHENDFYESAPWLHMSTIISNRSIREALRLCRLTILNDNYFKTTDISAGFPAWCSELESKYNPYYTDVRDQVLQFPDSVEPDYTKPINKPKYTKFWVDFKNEWTKAKK